MSRDRSQSRRLLKSPYACPSSRCRIPGSRQYQRRGQPRRIGSTCRCYYSRFRLRHPPRRSPKRQHTTVPADLAIRRDRCLHSHRGWPDPLRIGSGHGPSSVPIRDRSRVIFVNLFFGIPQLKRNASYVVQTIRTLVSGNVNGSNEFARAKFQQRTGSGDHVDRCSNFVSRDADGFAATPLHNHLR